MTPAHIHVMYIYILYIAVGKHGYEFTTVYTRTLNLKTRLKLLNNFLTRRLKNGDVVKIQCVLLNRRILFRF